MTSLVGIIARQSAPPAANLVPRMIESVAHRFETTTGHATFEPLGAHVGWAFSAEQLPNWAPARAEGAAVALFFAGEEFSAWRDYAPPDACSATPGAALLAAYLEHGSAVFPRLNGQFCGLLADERSRTFTLFNDRFGLGRVYYHETPEHFYFATEAKALLAILPSLRRLDDRGLAEYLSLGCVLQNRTLFPRIQLLPPGSAWVFDADGHVERRTYFDPATWEGQTPLTALEYGEQLRSVFARAAKRCLDDGAGIGMSLTGGLDSRAVIAWADAVAGTLPCYTFGGPYRDCADVRIARQLASVCRHPHTTIRIGEDFFSDFDVLAERAVHVTDGAMDVSGAVELHVNRQASGIAPIRLTGNYGSEILRSHVAFRPAPIDRSLFTPELALRLDEAVETYAAEAKCHRLSFIAFKQMPWHHFARRAVEASQLTPRSPFLDLDVVALAYRAPATLATSARPMLDLIAAGNPALAAIGTDRALRAGGPPLVSAVAHGWQELTVRAEYAYDYGMPQWLARADRMLTKLHLERLFLGRHKFYHFRIWYRDQLRDYVRDHLVAPAEAPACFRSGVIRELAAHHLSGRGNHTTTLHKALSISLINRLFLHDRG